LIGFIIIIVLNSLLLQTWGLKIKGGKTLINGLEIYLEKSDNIINI